ncbi:hypothetical protein MTO96_032200 [Rhipicephalus appendiculatus]
MKHFVFNRLNGYLYYSEVYTYDMIGSCVRCSTQDAIKLFKNYTVHDRPGDVKALLGMDPEKGARHLHRQDRFGPGFQFHVPQLRQLFSN